LAVGSRRRAGSEPKYQPTSRKTPGDDDDDDDGGCHGNVMLQCHCSTPLYIANKRYVFPRAAKLTRKR